MPQTPNHGYNVPNEGDQDWHEPLNQNFEAYDTDIEIRDQDGNKGNYEPKAGAKFLATDTGVVYVGDGSDWTATTAQARYEDASQGFAGNLVFGHPSNGVDGVDGATITGGGFDDGSNSSPNEVTGGGDFGTISGGVGNVVSSWLGTIGGGRQNSASGQKATIGGGSNNASSGKVATVGGGGANTATAQYASVAGGRANDAEDDYATVGGGENNTATAEGATVPGGGRNAARGKFSLAAGEHATAWNDGTFVWSDGSVTDFSSTAENQFLVNAGGGVGLGTNAPDAQLHVTDSVSGKAATKNHVAIVENTADGGSDDVLALKMNEDPPGHANNYVSFKDANGDGVGAIEGDGSGGVTTASAGNDYAEWLPRRNPDETIAAGDVVGVHGGAVSLTTEGTDRAMVVSTQPIVTGNDPGPAEEDREDHEKIAFVGQAPVKVRGVVDTGDLVVPSGEHDGTARAVSPATYGPGDGPIVGQAWEAADGQGVSEVTVAVGLEAGEVLEATVERQADRIDALEADNERKDDRIDTLEGQLAALKERVTTLEGSRVAPASADD